MCKCVVLEVFFSTQVSTPFLGHKVNQVRWMQEKRSKSVKIDKTGELLEGDEMLFDNQNVSNF